MNLPDMQGVCKHCSAETIGIYGCEICRIVEPLCRGHLGKGRELHKCPGAYAGVDKSRRQLYRRGDFSLDMQIIGEQGERRYFLCGPDDAMSSGVTLANLEAVWHLVGEAIVMEKKSK